MHLNKTYLEKKAQENIRKLFNQEGSIQLRAFFGHQSYLRLLDTIKRKKFKRFYKSNLYAYHAVSIHEKESADLLAYFFYSLFKKKPTLVSARAYSFQHGDYTLLHDATAETPGILFLIELTPHWESTYGGYHSFIQKNKELLRIYPVGNTLTLIRTQKDTRSFIKYINHTARPHKRSFILYRYQG